MIAVLMVISTFISVNAQIGSQDYGNNDERYYYDTDFDWHWDIRVKISNGIKRGLLTQNETNRLYGIVEEVERKEYAYQADGLFNGWEQQAVWNDVVYLNQCLGIELNDYDRNFYGFDVYGYDRRGYNRWFNQGGYDFYRFDKRGFGSLRFGYVPRPNFNGWYRNNNNFTARKYHTERSYHDKKGNNQYGNRTYRNYGNSRGNSDYKRNRPFGNDNNRNLPGSNDGNRNDRVENPNTRPNNSGGGFPNSGGRPERKEPNNRMDNGNRGSGYNGRTEGSQSGENGGLRGPR